MRPSREAAAFPWGGGSRDEAGFGAGKASRLPALPEGGWSIIPAR
jgi:hypothetical protein